MGDDRAWVGSPSLVGPRLIVRPLTLDDVDGLRSIAEMRFFEHFVSLQPASLAPHDFRAYVLGVLAAPRTVAVVARIGASGQTVATSSFMDIRSEHRALEIGMTWIGSRWQGTWVNPELKLLMLSHAFDRLGAVRVQLKCDARNLRSQSAIAKLGAVREGVLRNHAIQPNGFVRDTVMYSILDREWPSVRQGLETRLASLYEKADPAPDLG